MLKSFFCLAFVFFSYISYSQNSTVASQLRLNQSQNACNESFFSKTFTNSDFSASTAGMVATPDNGVIICGGITRMEASDAYDSYVMRISSLGKKQWEKNLSGPGAQALHCIVGLSDQNYIVVGSDEGPGPTDKASYFLLKFDINGNTIWRKDYYFVSGERMVIRQVKEDSDGSIILVAYHNQANLSFQDRILMIKYDKLGNLVFSNFFTPNDTRTNINVISVNDLLVKGGVSYLVGSQLYDPTGANQGFLLKVDNSNGQLIWTKGYHYNNREERFQRILDYPGSRLCITGTQHVNDVDVPTIFVCDTAGNVQSAKHFQAGLLPSLADAIIDNSGNLLSAGIVRSIPGLVVMLTNPLTGNVSWAKNHTSIGYISSFSEILYSNDSSIYFCGFEALEKVTVILSKFDRNGEFGCPPSTLDVKMVAGVSRVNPTNFLTTRKDFLPRTRLGFGTSNYISEGTVVCDLTARCTSVELTGDDSVCGVGDVLTATVNKNSGCQIIPGFAYDSSFFTLLSNQNGVATFKSLKSGSSDIRVNLASACDTLTDDLKVTILDSDNKVNLGPDTAICVSSVLNLSAGSGFSSYTWQDGSTDSVYSVNRPGVYFAKVTNACGFTSLDSIVITASPAVSFDLGGDLYKCNNDNITIHAPGGFASYFWSGENNVESRDSIFTVNPLKDAMYKVLVKNLNGCFGVDSVNVKVYQSAAINLGPDTNLCSGNSINLDAGPGFNKYIWNTGDTTSEIKVNRYGDYSVTASDWQGCQSFDTLRISAIFEKPVVRLSNDSTLCIGSPRVLDAGANFINYFWNTGETNHAISVSEKGVYYVNVTDKNGCHGSDTAIINTLFVKPFDFLPSDTSICNFESFLITATRSFNNYRWSTGNRQKSIAINKPANYILEVVDEYGCKGSDSIQITLKQCLEGFYVPNAFTPNADGINDSMKPFIAGKLSLYNFTIFNRWGQLIFTSSIPGIGWDGTLNGKQQDNNVFIWTCVLQFEGNPVQKEKGSFILIR